MDAPRIDTAVPQRRYQIGEFSAVLLGEIESADTMIYRYILALVREGDSKPCFYVTAEKNRRNEAAAGSYRMRVIAENYNQVKGSSDRWQELDMFAQDALIVARKALGLDDEQPVRLM